MAHEAEINKATAESFPVCHLPNTWATDNEPDLSYYPSPADGIVMLDQSQGVAYEINKSP